MQLLKKISFYVFIVLALAMAIWGYFKLKENKEPSSSVQEHIPNTAALIIETKNVSNNINQLTRQNLIWNGLLSESVFEETNKVIQYFDSILKLKEEVAQIIDNNPLYLSFFKDKNNYQVLIQFKCKEKNNQTIFEDFFITTFKTKLTEAKQDFFEVMIQQKKWVKNIKVC